METKTSADLANNVHDKVGKAATNVSHEVTEQVDTAAQWTADAWDFFSTHLVDFLMAILIFAIGYYIARFLRDSLARMMKRSRLDQLVVDFVTQGLYFFILILVALAALNKIGVPTDSFVMALGGMGLGVGLALKDNISNMAAGILILVFRPFRIGNYVQVSSAEGTVTQITLMNTHLRTIGRQETVVPNAVMISNAIVNYSVYPTRCMELLLDVAYSSDLNQVVSVLKDVVKRDGGVLNADDMLIGVREFADNSVRVYMRPEVDSLEYWPTYHRLMQSIKEAFDANGIDIPFPHRVLILEKAQDAPPLAGVSPEQNNAK